MGAIYTGGVNFSAPYGGKNTKELEEKVRIQGERIGTLEEKVPFDFATTSVGEYGYKDAEGKFHKFGEEKENGEEPEPTPSETVQIEVVTLPSGKKVYRFSSEDASPDTVAMLSESVRIYAQNSTGALEVYTRGADSAAIKVDEGTRLESTTVGKAIVQIMSKGYVQELIFGNGEKNKNSVIELPFSFGIDADGNCGFKKPGADTVTPFKSGGNFEVSWIADLKTMALSSAVVGNGLGVSGRLCAVQINENGFGQTKLRVVNSSGSIAAIDLGTELAAGGTDLYGIENKKIISKLKEILNLSFTPVIVYNPDAQTIAQIFSSDTNVMLPFMISERRGNPICFSVTHFWLETPI